MSNKKIIYRKKKTGIKNLSLYHVEKVFSQKLQCTSRLYKPEIIATKVGVNVYGREKV